jgi:hypothetical protein
MGFLSWFYVEAKAFELSVVEGFSVLRLKGAELCCLAVDLGGGVGLKDRGDRVLHIVKGWKQRFQSSEML